MPVLRQRIDAFGQELAKQMFEERRRFELEAVKAEMAESLSAQGLA